MADLLSTVEFHQLDGAETIEDVICLATLMAVKELGYDATVRDAIAFHNGPIVGDECGVCPYNRVCLACSINQ